jgi:hypothetical protein
MCPISSPEAASLGLIILNLPSQAGADSPRRRAEQDQPEASASGCVSHLTWEAYQDP